MVALRKPAPATKTCSNPECGIEQPAHLFRPGKRRCDRCVNAATRARARARGVPARVERFRVVGGVPEALCMEPGCAWKPFDAFWKDGRSGMPLPRCKDCRTARVLAWKAAHVERTRELQRKSSRACTQDSQRVAARRARLNRNYAIRKEWGSVAAWRAWCREDARAMFFDHYYASHVGQLAARSDQEAR